MSLRFPLHEENAASNMKKVFQTEYIFIVLLILINLVIGIATLTDYGESWDESRLYQYGDQSLNAYRALFNPGTPVDFGDDDLRYYGPAYFMGMALLVQGFHHILPQAFVIDLWHLGNFACLQIGLLFFYLITRHSLEKLPALTATALLASQPIIWGHGFINPKDVPFMALFTASVYFGLRMVETFTRQNFEVWTLLRNPWFHASAVSLGLTISIRILGFAAAGIVLFYFAFIEFKKVLRLTYAYFGSALVVSFLTWPYLWPSPIANFLKGIYAMLKFQWIGKVLFNGVYYQSNHLPRIYVPQLLAMQLTETVLILFPIGAAAFFWPALMKKYKNLFLLFSVWFVLPLLYILINGMNLYDNTRQLLFILPGLFLMTAIGLDLIFSWVRPAWVKTLVLVLVLLPGIAGILKYHPYEYTYYNFVTTSRTRIFRNFETDYWATSFKQVTSYLNENAQEDAQVIVWGPGQLIQHAARKDLHVKSFDDLKGNSYASYPYYLILTTRYDMDQKFFPEIEPVYLVQHNDSIFAVVKYITPQK